MICLKLTCMLLLGVQTFSCPNYLLSCFHVFRLSCSITCYFVVSFQTFFVQITCYAVNWCLDLYMSRSVKLFTGVQVFTCPNYLSMFSSVFVQVTCQHSDLYLSKLSVNIKMFSCPNKLLTFYQMFFQITFYCVNECSDFFLSNLPVMLSGFRLHVCTNYLLSC